MMGRAQIKDMEEQQIKDMEELEDKLIECKELLQLAGRFAEAAPDVEVKTNDGEIVDGKWLAAHIQDVLEKVINKPGGVE